MKRMALFLPLLALLSCQHKTHQSDIPNVASVWSANIQADTDTVHFELNLGAQNGQVIEGFFHGYKEVGAARTWSSQGQINGSISNSGQMTFTLDEGTNCTEKPTGTGDVQGDRMSVAIQGPSNCSIPYASLQGVIYRNGIH